MTYNVGDTVRLRSWDDLAEEFGEDHQGDIKIGEVWAFCSNKRRYGHLATIEEYDHMKVDIAEIDRITGTVQAEAVRPTLTFADLYSMV